MPSLLESLAGSLGGNNVADVIAKHVNADPQTVRKALAVALPLLVAALARNAQNPQGAAALHQAVQNDHDGRVLDDVKGYLSNPDVSDGQGILGHVLGGQQTAAQTQVSQATGLSTAGAGTLMASIAPLLMGAVGRAQQQGGLNPSGLSSLLGSETSAISQNPAALGSITQMLGGQEGGDVGDALAAAGKSLFSKFLHHE